MHMIRLIMEMESRRTPHRLMNPTTPNSMEMIEKATHREHSGLGMKIRLTTIMTAAATQTHWIVVGKTSMNCKRKRTNFGIVANSK